MRYFRMLRITTIIGILLVSIFLSKALASKYPSLLFMVKGKIVDWDTKKPICGVTLIVFLNDASYSTNDGWMGRHDYPNFSKTNEDGKFEAQTRLYRRNSEIKVKKMEIIAFCPGYRTERFIIRDPDFSLSADRDAGLIRDIFLELFKTKKR